MSRTYHFSPPPLLLPSSKPLSSSALIMVVASELALCITLAFLSLPVKRLILWKHSQSCCPVTKAAVAPRCCAVDANLQSGGSAPAIVSSLNSSPLTSLPCPLPCCSSHLLACFCLRRSTGSCTTCHSYALFLDFCVMGPPHLMSSSPEGVLTVFKVLIQLVPWHTPSFLICLMFSFFSLALTTD